MVPGPWDVNLAVLAHLEEDGGAVLEEGDWTNAPKM